jgi:hypothetical protein
MIFIQPTRFQMLLEDMSSSETAKMIFKAFAEKKLSASKENFLTLFYSHRKASKDLDPHFLLNIFRRANSVELFKKCFCSFSRDHKHLFFSVVSSVARCYTYLHTKKSLVWKALEFKIFVYFIAVWYI